jgi:hypothetical protein
VLFNGRLDFKTRIGQRFLNVNGPAVEEIREMFVCSLEDTNERIVFGIFRHADHSKASA